MTTTLPPLRTLAEERSLPSMTAPEWDRPLVAALIAAGMDLTALCCCGTPLIDHDGPLIDYLYGSQACAEAAQMLPGDVWNGGWAHLETTWREDS